MKLWLDDVRQPPDGTWLWVKNVSDAQAAVNGAVGSKDDIEVMSLDHDLGADLSPGLSNLSDDERYAAAGSSERNGFVFAAWLAAKVRANGVHNSLRNCTINIHSWNPDGAMRMVEVLRDVGLRVERIPFSITSMSSMRAV